LTILPWFAARRHKKIIHIISTVINFIPRSN
jgi:hypothetical protein